ncbi:MAG: GDP-mannose 4,6-dehydratase, partial [Flavobacteriales bacterium]
MKILVTGAAGFIGYHLCESLLKKGFTVVGMDNINDYYDQGLKYGRLSELGIDKADAESDLKKSISSKHGAKFSFVRLHLEDKKNLGNLFEEEKFTVVCNLAAQAGV